MVQFDVRANTAEMTRDLNKVQKSIVPKITSQAMNATVRKVRTESVRGISRAKDVKQKAVRKRFRAFFANPKKLIATVQAFVLPVRASDLGSVRQTRTGARVGKRSFPGQFVATMRSGHRGIFRRTFPERRGKQRRRGIDGQELPIKEATVPLEPEASRIIARVGNTVGKAFFLKEFPRLLKRRLNRKG